MLELFNLILRRQPRRAAGIDLGIHRTIDATIPFRMPAGVAGDVTRWPATIEPVLLDTTNPPTFFGSPGVINTARNSFRALVAGDSALTDVYGWIVRPYPFQQRYAYPNTSLMGAPFGQSIPATQQPGDILRRGYFLASLSGTPSTIHKGDPIFVWVAVSAAPHVQGGVETTATAGSTIAINPAKSGFNGPPDAQGLVEIFYNL